MKSGIVICSRIDSERVPGKPMKIIEGYTVIEHLVRRLLDVGELVIVAVPTEQAKFYTFLEEKYPEMVRIYPSIRGNDPLRRTAEAATTYDLDAVVRVTHDKIFLDARDVRLALDEFEHAKADYASGDFIPGTGFEIFSTELLKRCTSRFQCVEHLTYVGRLLSKKPIILKHYENFSDPSIRLLIDFPEDLRLIEFLLARFGPDATMSQVANYIRCTGWVTRINRQPYVSIYICAHNAEFTIRKAMNSVALQSVWPECELIVVDDHSIDQTLENVVAYASVNDRISWIRNDKNKGLSSSSNIAIKRARGKYVVRLDADDWFVGVDAISKLVSSIGNGYDVVYPDNYFGDLFTIQKGNEQHHVGGAIFRKSALDSVKFTDGLRGLEGVDLFLRAKETLRIRYLAEPVFFYTQRPDSMSKTNLEEREKIRKEIEARCGSKV